MSQRGGQENTFLLQCHLIILRIKTDGLRWVDKVEDLVWSGGAHFVFHCLTCKESMRVGLVTELGLVSQRCN
jgi:hypothetical protein